MSTLQQFKELVDSLTPKIENLDDLKSLLFSRKSLVFSTTFLTAYFCCQNLRQRYSVKPRWPPGPAPWPIIGNIRNLKPNSKKRIVDNCQDLVKQYGPMVHLYLGMGVDLVIISGTDLIQEALVKKGNVFSNRPLHLAIFTDRRDKGIIMQHGHSWSKIRRFTMKTMKDLGLNRASLPKAIQEEAMVIVKIFQETNGKPFHACPTFDNGVSNIICSLVFNQRFDHDDKVFREVLDAIDSFFTNSGSSQLTRTFLPKYIIKRLSSSVRKVDTAEDFMRSFIRKMIEKHRIDYDSNDMRDFTDYYLKYEISNDQDKISEKDMFKLIMDLFMAGTETTSTTLNWMVLYMITYQHVQEKCRKEIHEVIGTSRQPSWKDKGTLPYTEAMLLETQRIANIAPLAVPHCTSAPVELGGYLLPEKTVILPNLAESMTSERYWKDANTFKPERWLNQDGQLKTDVPKSFIPFGVGPRSCPGDNLAKMELFLFATCILQRVELCAESRSAAPDLTGDHHTIIKPRPFKTIAKSC